jgi:stearoyl-CoA desaturase (delta-9 desaturase)
MSDNFLILNLTFLSVLYIIDPLLFFSGAVGYVLEQLRTGIINCCLHIRNFPGNYRNHETSDNSQNNFIIGILSFGFGFHNNHHANQTKLILTERWFEIDLEGYLGWLLSKTNSNGSK